MSLANFTRLKQSRIAAGLDAILVGINDGGSKGYIDLLNVSASAVARLFFQAETAFAPAEPSEQPNRVFAAANKVNGVVARGIAGGGVLLTVGHRWRISAHDGSTILFGGIYARAGIDFFPGGLETVDLVFDTTDNSVPAGATIEITDLKLTLRLRS